MKRFVALTSTSALIDASSRDYLFMRLLNNRLLMILSASGTVFLILTLFF
jgi:hypothetical protein